MNQPKLKLHTAAQLNEEITPDPAAGDPAAPWALPADFPDVGLTHDQTMQIREWWTNACSDFLERVRAALTYDTHANTNLKNFSRNAIMLAHLLALHPACAGNLATLAKKSGHGHTALERAKAGILTILTTRTHTRKGTRSSTPSIRNLADALPQLDFTARSGKPPVIVVPFRWRLSLTQQWDTVCSLELFPHISATLELTADCRDAVRITWHKSYSEKD